MSHHEASTRFLWRDSRENWDGDFGSNCDFLRCVLRELLVLSSRKPALFTALFYGPWCLTTPLDTVAIEKARFLAHDSPHRAIGFIKDGIYFGTREMYIDAAISPINDLQRI